MAALMSFAVEVKESVLPLLVLAALVAATLAIPPLVIADDDRDDLF